MFKYFFILFLVLFVGESLANDTPNMPIAPTGPTSGISGIYYGYYVKTVDPNGDSIKYVIDWGDGTASTSPLMLSGSSVKMYHKWIPTIEQTFGIKVRAIDSYGLSSGWSPILNVKISGGAQPTNNPPGIPSVPVGPASGITGTSYSYSTKAIDPDGNQIKYVFDWGDGTASTTSLVSSGSVASSSHIWIVESGMTKTFNVRSKAIDEKGAESSWSGLVSVSINGPDLVNALPKTPRIPEGSLVGRTTYTYTYKTMANDPDGDMVKYTFDWGDGFMSTTDYVPSGTYASASHKWSGVTPGTFKGFYIKAMATDINGGKSAWSSPLPVSMGAPYVNHRPTIPVVSGPTKGISGVPYAFTIVASDPDEKDTLKYLIHWGDYSTETAYFPAGQPVTVYHTWNVPAGKTWICKIIAVAVDPYQLGSLDWSEPFVVTISAPSQELTLDVEENEITLAEEVDLVDTEDDVIEPTLDNTTILEFNSTNVTV